MYYELFLKRDFRKKIQAMRKQESVDEEKLSNLWLDSTRDSCIMFLIYSVIALFCLYESAIAIALPWIILIVFIQALSSILSFRAGVCSAFVIWEGYSCDARIKRIIPLQSSFVTIGWRVLLAYEAFGETVCAYCFVPAGQMNEYDFFGAHLRVSYSADNPKKPVVHYPRFMDSSYFFRSK